jgi:peroxisomal membrane protein 2
VKHLTSKVMAEYPKMQLNGWKLWPAAAMFNYRFVPLHLRVLFLNFVALIWCASH